MFTGSVVDYMKFSTFVLLACLSSLPTVLNFVFPVGVLRTRSCLLCHVFLPAMPLRCFSRWR
ncbi:hypothetical protein E2929_17830 [Escherichia coli]|uniref:Uncharacterized protein n=1 Tax=Escherichia coli TaxID=562 RepID=A0A2S1YAE5_ECOLX|nr:hypothetical protein C1467_21735 [Escherichia coli]AWJ51863.1 hypothetical protein I3W_27095 [Escherichia coli O43 str. RM10042]EEY7912430.1 hypothetical protein [Escherichia coli O21:H28]EFA5478623.1 hypothetical protein [Escherichia coli O8]EFN6743868.1 hypothetical protein [Escherichia coli O6]EFN6845236.1 hypothetical protein [Escherichia coli O139:H19]EFN7254574.1 hypothetical protein [Escherichia coli O43:H2]EFN7361252.1 hypothetical protein [Escherichia coli O180:H14]EFN8525714.1 